MRCVSANASGFSMVSVSKKQERTAPAFPYAFDLFKSRMIASWTWLHPSSGHTHHAALAQQKTLHHAHPVLSLMGMTKRNNVHLVNRLIKLVLKRNARDSIYS